MKATFSNGGQKFRSHDVMNSCGKLNMTATTQAERFLLAAILRAVSCPRTGPAEIHNLRSAIFSASERCMREHEQAAKKEPEYQITSGSIS